VLVAESTAGQNLQYGFRRATQSCTQERHHKSLTLNPGFDKVPRQVYFASLSCVLVSKSVASWRSCNWLEGSPKVQLTMRPRLTAGR